ncbi:MAG TPA: methyltransferase domain-containing protein [Candidatus Polarisedimenticolaceae bacterium]|nr:methyltransferase domain-containing protein [Candidatus Polarisedimenticolaceae bacterium]
MIRPRAEITPARVADHYDELDPIYRRIWGDHVHHGLWETGRESPALAVRRLVGRVAGAGGFRPGDSVCDIGCGYGATARELARNHRLRVTGITLSAVQFDYASRRAARDARVEIRLGDWLANDFADRSFDGAIAIESTEHIADKERCFAEMRRVLRPGGRVVICAWLASDEPRNWHVRHLLEPICREGRLAGMATAREYRAWLERAGLDPIGFDDLSDRVRRTWTICIRRFLGALPRDRALRRYLWAATSRNRVFAATRFRIRLAYAAGAMRYGLFVAVRPSDATPHAAGQASSGANSASS